MPRKTRAQVEADRIVGNHPPFYGRNRLGGFEHCLVSHQGRTPSDEFPAIQETLVAELGIWPPRAFKLPMFLDGSSLVIISSGLIDFVEAVSRSFHGAARFTGSRAPPAALETEKVNNRLHSLYQQWQTLWKQQPLDSTQIALDPDIETIATAVTQACLFFFLMHEFAHVALHPDLAEHECEPSHELEADAWAIRQIMLRSGIPFSDERRLLAGAVIAVRLLRALEVMGHSFLGNYPPPAIRVAGVLNTFAEICGSEFEFHFHATLASTIKVQLARVEHNLRATWAARLRA